MFAKRNGFGAAEKAAVFLGFLRLSGARCSIAAHIERNLCI